MHGRTTRKRKPQRGMSDVPESRNSGRMDPLSRYAGCTSLSGVGGGNWRTCGRLPAPLAGASCPRRSKRRWRSSMMRNSSRLMQLRMPGAQPQGGATRPAGGRPAGKPGAQTGPFAMKPASCARHCAEASINIKIQARSQRRLHHSIGVRGKATVSGSRRQVGDA